VNCLRQLALGEVSACGRNWYLTEALCTDGLDIKPTVGQTKKRIYSGDLYDLFLLLTVLLDADKTIDVIETAHFHFTDVDQHFVLKVC
jgi:alkyl sulfatase BDS1-like metallo-beta-lactamase superfamily hydrolase